jgi:hypothetical protein
MCKIGPATAATATKRRTPRFNQIYYAALFPVPLLSYLTSSPYLRHLFIQLTAMPRLVGGSPGVVGQAVCSGTGFVVAHMGILAPVPVVAAGPLLRPVAAPGSVEMVAYAVPLELGTPPLHYRAAPRQAAGAAAPPTSGPFAPAVGASPMPLRILAPSRLLHVGRPLLDALGPALLALSKGQRRFFGHRPTGALPQHAVDEVHHQPANKTLL